MKKKLMLIVLSLVIVLSIKSQEINKSTSLSNLGFAKIIDDNGLRLKDTITCKNELFVNGELIFDFDSISIFKNSTVIALGKNSYEIYEKAIVRVNKYTNNVDFLCESFKQINLKNENKKTNIGFYYYKCDFDSQIIITKELENEKIYNYYINKIEKNEKLDL